MRACPNGCLHVELAKVDGVVALHMQSGWKGEPWWLVGTPFWPWNLYGAELGVLASYNDLSAAGKGWAESHGACGPVGIANAEWYSYLGSAAVICGWNHA